VIDLCPYCGEQLSTAGICLRCGRRALKLSSSNENMPYGPHPTWRQFQELLERVKALEGQTAKLEFKDCHVGVGDPSPKPRKLDIHGSGNYYNR